MKPVHSAPDIAIAPVRRVNRTLIVYGGFQSLSILGLYAVTVNLPLIAGELSFTSSQVVMIATMYLLGFAIGLPISGRLIDAAGFVRIVQWGLIAYAVSSLLAALVSSLEALIVLRLIAGLASSVMAVSGAILGAQVIGAQQKLATLSMTMALVIMGALAPLIGGLVGDRFGWRVAVALPLVILFVGIPVLRGVRRNLAVAPNRPQRLDVIGMLLISGVTVGLVFAIQGGLAATGLLALIGLIAVSVVGTILWTRSRPKAFVPRAVLTNRSIMLGALVGHFVAAGSAVAYIVLPLYLAARYNMNPITIGLMACLAAVIGAVSTLIAARVRVRRPKVLLVPLVLLSSVGLALVCADNVDLFVRVLAVGLAQSSYGGVHAILLLQAQRDTDSRLQGISIGTFQTVFYVGGSVGAALLTSLLRFTDLGTASMLIALVPLCALPIIWLLRFSPPDETHLQADAHEQQT